MTTETVTREQLNAALASYAKPEPPSQLAALQAVVVAAARVRHTTEQGQGVARYEAWRDMCAALDALKGLA